MRKKRWKKRRHYPKDWKIRAHACKSEAGWICEVCGEAHLTIKVSKRTGQVYPMYLHAAHIGRYTKHPKLKALCPRCHGKLDWQERQRRARVKMERLKHLRMLVER